MENDSEDETQDSENDSEAGNGKRDGYAFFILVGAGLLPIIILIRKSLKYKRIKH
ncbi:MAG: hypothetical protein R6U96_01860 [Promethearchaeia archaeon]